MKPTTEDVLRWSAEVWSYDTWTITQLQRLEKFAALAYAAGAAAEREECIDAIPPQYYELRDRLRARGEKND